MDNVELRRENPKFPCRYCDNTFSSKNAKRKHIGKVQKNRNQLIEGPRESLQSQQAKPQDVEAETVKENPCREEKEAGMARLSRQCSPTSRTVDTSTRELNMEDLRVLDMMQMQDLCGKGSLVSSRNKTTVIDRLLNRFIIHDQHLAQLIFKILNIDNEYAFTYSIFTHFHTLFCSVGPTSKGTFEAHQGTDNRQPPI